MTSVVPKEGRSDGVSTPVGGRLTGPRKIRISFDFSRGKSVTFEFFRRPPGHHKNFFAHLQVDGFLPVAMRHFLLSRHPCNLSTYGSPRLFPTPYSLLPTPYSLLPSPWSLAPVFFTVLWRQPRRRCGSWAFPRRPARCARWLPSARTGGPRECRCRWPRRSTIHAR